MPAYAQERSVLVSCDGVVVERIKNHRTIYCIRVASSPAVGISPMAGVSEFGNRSHHREYRFIE